MSVDSASINLTNHFLIAMPGLEDAIFGKSVVFVCEHSPRGALGLVINKPADMTLGSLFGKVALELGRADLVDTLVVQGGPVQTERGFVLHKAMADPDSTPADAAYASTMSIPGGLEMTTSKDVLEALASGAGPQKVLITLGYSAWGEGQLEAEIAENSWLTVDADPAVIFDTPVDQRYERACGLLGLQSWMLSTQVGHA
jgi:putative transcriptional regulator